MSRSVVRGLKVPSLGQVGIVVRDVDEARRYYEENFGIGPWAVFQGEPVWCVNKGEKASFKGKIAMANAGAVQVELIQILEGDSIHSDFLESHGEGLHHVGFFVRDLKERLASAREAGIEVLQHGLLRQMGLSIEYAYLDTTETGGVIIEYIEARFMGMPFPMRSPLPRIGARLAEKLGKRPAG